MSQLDLLNYIPGVEDLANENAETVSGGRKYRVKSSYYDRESSYNGRRRTPGSRRCKRGRGGYACD